MDTIEKLTEIFKEFPGIGERQAKRFVYFLMSKNGSYVDNLLFLVKDLKKEIAQCEDCFRFFITKKSKETMCDICTNPRTDQTILMVVEKDSDLESVRKSRIYHGKYFVLGGLVPIVEKNTKGKVRINELINQIKKQLSQKTVFGEDSKRPSFGSNLKEIILAFSLNPQGDHTDLYVRSELKDIVQSSGIKISSLGRGLSTGTELEYSDNDTIKNALKNRQ